MENTNASPQYEQYFALSIKGASHYDSGKPMQDYSKAARAEDHCIGIVCDGHGSDKHFRSEVGSRLATEVTFDLLSQWATTYPTWEAFNVDVPDRLERLKLAILTGWQRAVEEYTAQNPITEEEMTKASNTFKSRKTFDVGTPYGTTLLATLMCRDYYLVIMLGDGAIMKIKPGEGDNPAATATGAMVEFPGKKVYDDSPHSATDSLCSPESYYSIFFSYGQLDEEEDYGVLFALGSDGISEAFMKDESLVKEFMLHFDNYLQVGMEQALQDSENRLNRLSQVSAAHDDISIAYVTFHEEAYARIIPEVVEPEEVEEVTEETTQETQTTEDTQEPQETVVTASDVAVTEPVAGSDDATEDDDITLDDGNQPTLADDQEIMPEDEDEDEDEDMDDHYDDIYPMLNDEDDI